MSLTRVSKVLFVLLIAPIAACGGASGSTGAMKVTTSGAEISSVARFRTYTLAAAENAPEEYARGALTPAAVEKVTRGVDAELAAKGYVRADDGELVVRISTGRRSVEVQPTGSASLAGAPEQIKTEGALVIDIFERESGRPLFHGYARDIVQGGEVKDGQIAEAISKILEPVPTSMPGR